MPLVAMNLAASDYGMPSPYPIGVNEMRDIQLSDEEFRQMTQTPFPSRAELDRALNINPSNRFGQQVSVVANAIQSLVSPYLQAQAQSSALRMQQQTQQRNEAQQIKNALQQRQGSDNTDYYLIGGGVLLAGLLLFAIARRK